MYPYGQSFTRWYYPLVDNQTPASVLQVQTPAIYIFAAQPSRVNAISGVGAIQTVTSWTWDPATAGWSYTVAAIPDPTPTSTLSTAVYWEAVNYVLQTGGQVQTDIRALEMQRVTGHSVSVNVNDDVLKAYYPQLDSCSTTSQRTASVNLAVESVKSELKSKGYEWAKLTRPDRLSMAIATKALSMIMLVQLQQGNDKYDIKYNEFKALYQSTIDGLSLEYDADGDGKADSIAKASSGPIFLVR